ncbi:hypothetical protein A6U94_04570 [Agrobacterium tumefaciens]|nr:hypothetical protein A6U94_04570 [Agrobacterium tumefaciens]
MNVKPTGRGNFEGKTVSREIAKGRFQFSGNTAAKIVSRIATAKQKLFAGRIEVEGKGPAVLTTSSFKGPGKLFMLPKSAPRLASDITHTSDGRLQGFGPMGFGCLLRGVDRGDGKGVLVPYCTSIRDTPINIMFYNAFSPIFFRRV